MGLGRGVPAVTRYKSMVSICVNVSAAASIACRGPRPAPVELGREMLFELRTQDPSGPVELVSDEVVGAGAQPRRTCCRGDRFVPAIRARTNCSTRAAVVSSRHVVDDEQRLDTFEVPVDRSADEVAAVSDIAIDGPQRDPRTGRDLLGGWAS